MSRKKSWHASDYRRPSRKAATLMDRKDIRWGQRYAGSDCETDEPERPLLKTQRIQRKAK